MHPISKGVVFRADTARPGIAWKVAKVHLLVVWRACAFAGFPAMSLLAYELWKGVPRCEAVGLAYALACIVALLRFNVVTTLWARRPAKLIRNTFSPVPVAHPLLTEFGIVLLLLSLPMDASGSLLTLSAFVGLLVLWGITTDAQAKPVAVA